MLVLVVANKLSSSPHLERRIADIIGPKYTVEIGSASFNPIRGTFSAENVAIEPDTVHYPEPRRRRWHFTAASVHIDGIRRWALYQKSIQVGNIRVDAPRLQVYFDRHVESTTRSKKSRLPHERLKGVEHPIHVETIELAKGEIIYKERARDGARPGTFVFSDLSAMITNVTNDSSHMDTPCTIDVQMTLATSARLRGVFEYDFASEALDLDCRASIGKMDARLLNDLLVNLNGIRVLSGTIDSTWFDFKVDNDLARGQVHCLYRGVEFEMLDKNTLEQGIKDKLITVLNQHRTRSSNPEKEGAPPVTANVTRRREPGVNIIKFVWQTVRQGLLQTLGVAD